MKYIAILLCSLLVPFSAVAAPPSPESIDKLFRLVELDKMMQLMVSQSEQMMKAGMDEALKRNNANPEMRERAAAMQQKMGAVIRDELSLAKLQPLISRVYIETFTQEEVDGLIAFYDSPAGRAMITKMPIAMNRTMSLMQQRMGPMMERMKKAVQDTVGTK
jgi:hypothetical protein